MEKVEKKSNSIIRKNTSLASDLFVGVVMVALAITLIVTAQKLPTKERGIGPGIYPTVISSILLILGFAQAVKSLVVAKGIPVPDWKNTEWKKLLRVAIMVLACYLFYVLLKPVGFLIMAPIFLYSAILFFGYKRKILALIVTVIFTTGVYFLFRQVFQVMLPQGILG